MIAHIKNCFKFPNAVITDMTISYSAKAVCAVIYAYNRGEQGSTISVKRITAILKCNDSLVYDALTALEDKEYISRKHNSIAVNGKRQKGTNTYFCTVDMSKDFTFVPRKAIYKKTTYASLSVYFYLLNQGFIAGRAFPSITKIIEATGISKSTILRAAKLLCIVGLVIKRQCLTTKHCYTSSSYFLVRLVNACQELSTHFLPKLPNHSSFPLFSIIPQKLQFCNT